MITVSDPSQHPAYGSSWGETAEEYRARVGRPDRTSGGPMPVAYGEFRPAPMQASIRAQEGPDLRSTMGATGTFGVEAEGDALPPGAVLGPSGEVWVPVGEGDAGTSGETGIAVEEGTVTMTTPYPADDGMPPAGTGEPEPGDQTEISPSDVQGPVGVKEPWAGWPWVIGGSLVAVTAGVLIFASTRKPSRRRKARRRSR